MTFVARYVCLGRHVGGARGGSPAVKRDPCVAVCLVQIYTKKGLCAVPAERSRCVECGQ